MKRVMPALLQLILILALAVQPTAAENPNKIIDRYKKASGGGALKRIRSTFISGTLKSSDGKTGRFTYQATSPDRFRTDIEVDGTRVSECHNGKSAWRMDQRGLRTLLGAEAKRLRLDALIAGSRLRELSRSRIVPQTPLKSTVEGRAANAIEVIKDDARMKLFFDASTYLMIKQERERSDGTEEIFFSDYRAVDGVMEPFAIKLKSGPTELLVSVDRVEHNRSVEEVVFRHPRVDGERPLPDLEVLMKAVIGNQERIEELVDRYTFRMTQTERKQEGNGQLREGDTKVYEITPVHGTPVRRLVSVNGKELPPSEREKEDRRVQKAVEDLTRRHDKEQKKEEQARTRGKKDDEEDDGGVSLLDFLRISEVTSVRREVFRGHEVIAFDFEPRKGFKPRNRGENLVNKLAGTMWVDENARQVARAEARLTDSFKIGGGLLASISPATALVMEQEKVGDEVWLPSYNEMNLSARVFLFAKLRRNFVTRFSDYKKYQIDDKYELSKPKEAAKP